MLNSTLFSTVSFLMGVKRILKYCMTSYNLLNKCMVLVNLWPSYNQIKPHKIIY